ncbi:MAG: type II toxin-antitoxin system prevent-host-death family antitoxin [Thermoanaerobaculia bacterium]
MRQMGAAKFKEQCLAILGQLDAEGVVITKHGKPVARLIPWERAAGSLIGCLQGRIRVNGDLLSTGVAWDASA